MRLTLDRARRVHGEAISGAMFPAYYVTGTAAPQYKIRRCATGRGLYCLSATLPTRGSSSSSETEGTLSRVKGPPSCIRDPHTSRRGTNTAVRRVYETYSFFFSYAAHRVSSKIFRSRSCCCCCAGDAAATDLGLARSTNSPDHTPDDERHQLSSRAYCSLERALSHRSLPFR